MEGALTDLVHGVDEPLRVGGEALCQLADALRHLSLLAVVRGGAQVVEQLFCDDLQCTYYFLSSSAQLAQPHPHACVRGAKPCP